MKSVADSSPEPATDVGRRRPGRPRKPRKRGRRIPSHQITLNKLRSAVTNGAAILDQVDHRSSWMRRLRDLIDSHTSDLGGADVVTEGERRLIRRSAMLTLQLEMMESRWAENDGEASAKQLDAYQRVTGALRRTLESLGLRRRQKPVPSLAEYLERRSLELEALEAKTVE